MYFFERNATLIEKNTGFKINLGLGREISKLVADFIYYCNYNV